MIQVEGHKNLYRDDNTGAIINCDQQGYVNNISQKKEREKLKNDVQNLKSELSEIKLLLKEIINGQQKNQPKYVKSVCSPRQRLEKH